MYTLIVKIPTTKAPGCYHIFSITVFTSYAQVTYVMSLFQFKNSHFLFIFSVSGECQSKVLAAYINIIPDTFINIYTQYNRERGLTECLSREYQRITLLNNNSFANSDLSCIYHYCALMMLKYQYNATKFLLISNKEFKYKT